MIRWAFSRPRCGARLARTAGERLCIFSHLAHGLRWSPLRSHLSASPSISTGGPCLRLRAVPVCASNLGGNLQAICSRIARQFPVPAGPTFRVTPCPPSGRVGVDPYICCFAIFPAKGLLSYWTLSVTVPCCVMGPEVAVMVMVYEPGVVPLLPPGLLPPPPQANTPEAATNRSRTAKNSLCFRTRTIGAIKIRHAKTATEP
jgi:hypothetical protein